MTTEEFSDQFDIMVSSYRRFKDFDNKEIDDSIEFNEYEKSVFLTKAERDIVESLYSGNNKFGDSFESSEELRRDLDSLVITASLEASNSQTGLSQNSKFFVLPSDLMFITLEQVTINDSTAGLYNNKRITVLPVTQDEYDEIKNNPFRGPTDYKAIRLDCGNNSVELISKYIISNYIIRYLKKPNPIILEKLPDNLNIDGSSDKTECTLSSNLHYRILEEAVRNALMSKAVEKS